MCDFEVMKDDILNGETFFNEQGLEFLWQIFYFLERVTVNPAVR
jgi:hypothetical protein